MEHFSPEVLAMVIAGEFAQAHPDEVDDAIRDELAARIVAALRRMARLEREACVAQCLERQAMWESTEARSTTSEPLRQEARARCNEAAVIADALRAGGPRPD